MLRREAEESSSRDGEEAGRGIASDYGVEFWRGLACRKRGRSDHDISSLRQTQCTKNSWVQFSSRHMRI